MFGCGGLGRSHCPQQTAARCAEGSDALVPVLGQQALALVLDVGGHAGQGLGVLTPMVRAEQKLAGLQVYPDVGLGSAGVATVGAGQFGGGMFCG